MRRRPARTPALHGADAPYVRPRQSWSAGVLTGHRTPGAPASSPATAPGGHGPSASRPTVHRHGGAAGTRPRCGGAAGTRPRCGAGRRGRRRSMGPALHGAGAPWGRRSHRSAWAWSAGVLTGHRRRPAAPPPPRRWRTGRGHRRGGRPGHVRRPWLAAPSGGPATGGGSSGLAAAAPRSLPAVLFRPRPESSASRCRRCWPRSGPRLRGSAAPPGRPCPCRRRRRCRC